MSELDQEEKGQPGPGPAEESSLAYWERVFGQAAGDKDKLLHLVKQAASELKYLNPERPDQSLRYAMELSDAIAMAIRKTLPLEAEFESVEEMLDFSKRHLSFMAERIEQLISDKELLLAASAARANAKLEKRNNGD